MYLVTIKYFIILIGFAVFLICRRLVSHLLYFLICRRLVSLSRFFDLLYIYSILFNEKICHNFINLSTSLWYQSHFQNLFLSLSRNSSVSPALAAASLERNSAHVSALQRHSPEFQCRRAHFTTPLNQVVTTTNFSHGQ